MLSSTGGLSRRISPSLALASGKIVRLAPAASHDGGPHDPLEPVVGQKILYLLEFVEHDNGPVLPGKQFLWKIQHFRQRLRADRRVRKIEGKSRRTRLIQRHLRPEALEKRS